MSLYNFTINQGATCQFTVNYTDSDGAAVDLAGHEAALQIKNAHYSDGLIHGLFLINSLTLFSYHLHPLIMVQ